MNYGSFSVKTEIQEAFIFGVGSAVTVIIFYLTFREATSISIVLCLLAPPAMCCCPFQPLLMPVIFCCLSLYLQCILLAILVVFLGERALRCQLAIMNDPFVNELNRFLDSLFKKLFEF